MIPRIMGLLERAVYEVQDHQDEAGHFGLAREHYLHFTSPIRRYPDLMVHRLLFDVLMRGKPAQDELRDPEKIRDLFDVAEHSSMQAEVASMVEIAIDDLKICQYMDARIDQVFMATVGRISRAGFDVEITAECVKGYLPARSIGKVVQQDGPMICIRGRTGTKTFREGDQVQIRVENVDFKRLKVMFLLTDKKR